MAELHHPNNREVLRPVRPERLDWSGIPVPVTVPEVVPASVAAALEGPDSACYRPLDRDRQW